MLLDLTNEELAEEIGVNRSTQYLILGEPEYKIDVLREMTKL